MSAPPEHPEGAPTTRVSKPSLGWEDVRIFLAVARRGSLRAASNELGLNHATISRRMQAFERSFDTQLFERRGSALALTPTAAAVMEMAERMEVEAHAFERRLRGRDTRPTGEVSVALPGVLIPTLAPTVARLREDYPQLILTLHEGREELELARRDVDVVLRAAESLPVNLDGKRVGWLGARVYAHHTFRGRPPELPWIAWASARSDPSPELWRRAHHPDGAVAARVSSSIAAQTRARAGLGAAVLACVVGDADPELRAISRAPVFRLPLWLVVHPEVRSLPRVRLVVSAVESALEESAAELAGTA